MSDTTTNPEVIERILRERARKLAAVPEDDAKACTRREVLRFQLGPRHYALDTDYVFATRWLHELAPVPEAPPAIIGITPQQGGVLPVAALDLLFGNAPTGLRDTHRIIVVGHDRPELALVAGKDIEIARLAPEDLLPPPGSADRASQALIAGMTEDGLTVLDGDALLRDERLFSRTASRSETTPGGPDRRM
ncbi:MAG: chemotaxis protein CheW [Planctomycetota bacterium]|nr:chemotaxis protein CheW [Planctomycetota bacterium]